MAWSSTSRRQSRSTSWIERRGARARAGALALVVALLALTAGCGGGSTSSSSSRGELLRLGVVNALDTFNAARDAVSGATVIRYLASETLIAKDPATGDYEPGLATRFGFVGRDNMAYELTLRRGVRFNDGTPLDAAAVKTWLDYFRSARGPYAGLIAIRDVEAPDKFTVRINFATPSPNVQYFLSGGNNWGFVASPRAVANPKQLSSTVSGVGAYVLDTSGTVGGDHYTFRPNPDYYDPSRVHWRKIVVRVLAEPSTMLKAMQSDELDAALGDFSTARAAEKLPNARVWFGIGGWDPILLMPRYSEPLKDVRVRRALNYAIDREAITTAIAGRYGKPTSEWVTTDGFDPAYQDYYEYDPAKARALLQEAGYGDGFTLKIVTQGYVGALGDPMVQVVADYLARVGVKLDITKTASPSEHFTKGPSGDYGAWQFAVGSVPTATFLSLFTDASGYVPDPVLDSIAARASKAPPEQAGELWKEFSRRTVTQASMLNVFTTPYLIYADKDITGIQVSPAFGVSPGLLDWQQQ